MKSLVPEPKKENNFPFIAPSATLLYLPLHLSQLIEEIREILKKNIPERNVQSLPQIVSRYFPILIPKILSASPVTFSLTVICSSQKYLSIEDDIRHMLTTSFISDKTVQVLSSRSLQFYFVNMDPRTDFHFMELVLEVKETNEENLQLLFPILIEKIRLGLSQNHPLSPFHYVKAIPAQYKDTLILAKISHWMRIWPDAAEKMYSSTLQFLLSCSQNFKKIRSNSYLSRIAVTRHVLKEKVIHYVDGEPHKRHLELKLLRTSLSFPFGDKQAVGILIVFNPIHKLEVLAEFSVLEIVKKAIPQAKEVPSSYLEIRDTVEQFQTTYLEIQKQPALSFSKQELEKLKATLSLELNESIEQNVPITFMRRNEEEIYHSILLLQEELKSIRSLPQVSISFEEQTSSDLIFNVVLARLTKEETTSIQEMFQKANPKVIFLSDRSTILGKYRNKYFKEAHVFRLQLPKDKFFRKNRSVNLYKARCQVLEYLTNALGPVRDYNGGLILTQNQKFEDFLAASSEVSNHYDSFILENFFYSITPIAMQSLLPTSVIQSWFSLFFNSLQNEKNHEYSIHHTEDNNYFLIAIIGENPAFKNTIMQDLNKSAKLHNFSFTLAEMTIKGSYCLGILYNLFQIKNEIYLLKIVEEAFSKWLQENLQQQHLRINLKAPEPSLDPRSTSTDQAYLIIKMLFEGLTRIGPNGVPQLALAKCYHQSADQKTYTFHLRSCHWSNGNPVTAYDFEYSWKTALKPNTDSIYSYTFFVIKNARKAKENQISLDEVGIKALDEKTLVIELEHRIPHFLELTAHWTYCLVNSNVDRKFPEWAYQSGENFVCCGPFQLVEWKHQRTIEIVKNPHYWDSNNVKLDRITIFMLNNSELQQQLFKENKLDIIGRPMSSYPLGLVPREDEEQVTYPLHGIYCLWFNHKKFPFYNTKIRQAFGLAINRKNLEKLIAHEFHQWTNSIFPQNLFPHTTYLDSLEASPDKAKKLLLEGLAELGATLKDIPPISLSFAKEMNREKALSYIKQQWQETFGINQIFLEEKDWKTHFNCIRNGDYQIGGMELNYWWRDPFHILDCFTYQSDHQNVTRWEHPLTIEIIQKARLSQDPEEQKKLIKEINKIFNEEYPIIPLYEFTGSYMKKKYLKGVTPSPFFEIDFKNAYLETP